MSDLEEDKSTAPAEPSSDSVRPAFMGPEAPVDDGHRKANPSPKVDECLVEPTLESEAAQRGAGRRRARVPASIVGALLLGLGLGIGGTLLFAGGNDSDPDSQPAQATSGPADGSGAATEITLPRVGADDPDAFGIVDIAGTALPRFDGENDFAVGMAAPELRGHDFEGNPVSVTNDGRAKIILFVSHWCPYCQQEIPVVRDWYDTTELPDDVDVYSVSTLTDFTRSNYPPRAWLEQEVWNVQIIVDDDLDTAAEAFGLNAVPFWVLIDANGTIAGRHAGGGVPAEVLDSIAQQLSSSAAHAESGQ